MIFLLSQKSFDGNAEIRGVRPGSPMEWLMDNTNEKFTSLMVHVRDKNLPKNLIEMVNKLEKQPGEAECIKLFLCKSSPFITGMQRAINERLDGESNNIADEELYKKDRVGILFKYIPDLNEFKIHGAACEDRYNNCNIY